MTSKKLAATFQEAALDEAQPIGIGSNCEGYVRDFIRTGVARMEAEGALDDPVRVSEAEHNLRKFVDGMKQEAATLGQNYLGENTFFPSRDQLCPLWPFC